MAAFIHGNENEIEQGDAHEYIMRRIIVTRNDNFKNDKKPGGTIYKSIQVGMRYGSLLKEIAETYNMKHE